MRIVMPYPCLQATMRIHKNQMMNTINNTEVTTFTQYERTSKGESDIQQRLQDIAEDFSDGPLKVIVVRHRRLLKEYLKE